MGLVFNRRKKIGGTTLNMSKRGVSASRKAGPLRVNSRGKATLRLGKGISFKF